MENIKDLYIPTAEEIATQNRAALHHGQIRFFAANDFATRRQITEWAHAEALEINRKFVAPEPSKTIVIKVQKLGFMPNFVADIKAFPSAPHYKLTNNLEFAKKANSLAEAERVAEHYRDNGYFVEFIEIKNATFADI